jgi:hypothetical protein
VFNLRSRDVWWSVFRVPSSSTVSLIELDISDFFIDFEFTGKTCNYHFNEVYALVSLTAGVERGREA